MIKREKANRPQGILRDNCLRGVGEGGKKKKKGKTEKRRETERKTGQRREGGNKREIRGNFVPSFINQRTKGKKKKRGDQKENTRRHVTVLKFKHHLKSIINRREKGWGTGVLEH